MENDITMTRYPKWKVDLFRNRDNDRCTCRNNHIPGVTSERFDPWCAIHGDEDARTGRSIVENDAIQAEHRE